MKLKVVEQIKEIDERLSQDLTPMERSNLELTRKALHMDQDSQITYSENGVVKYSNDPDILA
ncbi:MAG: hypothetical protein Q4A21_03040 [bacterium]|nr:hypothetical protein [bacterium]